MHGCVYSTELNIHTCGKWLLLFPGAFCVSLFSYPFLNCKKKYRLKCYTSLTTLLDGTQTEALPIYTLYIRIYTCIYVSIHTIMKQTFIQTFPTGTQIFKSTLPQAHTGLKHNILLKARCPCKWYWYHNQTRVSFGGGICPPLDHKCLPLEFEKAKLLDMSSTSVKPQETLVVSLVSMASPTLKIDISRLIYMYIAAD